MDTSATTEKALLGSLVCPTPIAKKHDMNPNNYNKKYDKFTELFKHEEWTFLRDDQHMYQEDYHFLVHNDCPGGFNIRPDGAVMHFETLKCQQCNKSPSDEMMAVYVLYRWHVDEKFGVFDDGTIE